MSNKLIVSEKNGTVDLSDIRFYVDGDMFSVAQLVEAWRTERERVKTLENALRVYVSYRDSGMAGSTSKRAQQARTDLHHMIEAAIAALHSPTKAPFHPDAANERETAEPYISEGLQWLPIETAPTRQDTHIIAKFWHGPGQVIVEATSRGDGGWQDVAYGSCVGWLPGGKPGFWLCEVAMQSGRKGAK